MPILLNRLICGKVRIEVLAGVYAEGKRQYSEAAVSLISRPGACAQPYTDAQDAFEMRFKVGTGMSEGQTTET